MRHNGCTLWGWHPSPRMSLTEPIRLMEDPCTSDIAQRERDGWLTGTYAKGDNPEGLRLQVRERLAKAAKKA